MSRPHQATAPERVSRQWKRRRTDTTRLATWDEMRPTRPTAALLCSRHQRGHDARAGVGGRSLLPHSLRAKREGDTQLSRRSERNVGSAWRARRNGGAARDRDSCALLQQEQASQWCQRGGPGTLTTSVASCAGCRREGDSGLSSGVPTARPFPGACQRLGPPGRAVTSMAQTSRYAHCTLLGRVVVLSLERGQP